MARQLAYSVQVDGEWYYPGDKVPANVAKQIGDHAWTDTATDDGGNPPYTSTPPPMGGAGSGAEAWALYAAELDVAVPADAKRDDIVEAIKAAGHPVEQAPAL